MPTSNRWRAIVTLVVTTFLAAAVAQAQSIGGTVIDPTGAVVSNATVEINNPVSKYRRSTGTDASGKFGFPNVRLTPTT